MDEEKGPPELPGEVWRGEGSPLPVPYAVTRGYPIEGLSAWEWYATNETPAGWYLIQDHERRARIFAAWALAMRSERGLALALANAAQEREAAGAFSLPALREALDAKPGEPAVDAAKRMRRKLAEVEAELADFRAVARGRAS